MIVDKLGMSWLVPRHFGVGLHGDEMASWHLIPPFGPDLPRWMVVVLVTGRGVVGVAEAPDEAGAWSMLGGAVTDLQPGYRQPEWAIRTDREIGHPVEVWQPPGVAPHVDRDRQGNPVFHDVPVHPVHYVPVNELGNEHEGDDDATV